MPANLDEASAVASAIRRSIRMSLLARNVTRLSCLRFGFGRTGIGLLSPVVEPGADHLIQS